MANPEMGNDYARNANPKGKDSTEMARDYRLKQIKTMSD